MCPGRLHHSSPNLSMSLFHTTTSNKMLHLSLRLMLPGPVHLVIHWIFSMMTCQTQSYSQLWVYQIKGKCTQAMWIIHMHHLLEWISSTLIPCHSMPPSTTTTPLSSMVWMGSLTANMYQLDVELKWDTCTLKESDKCLVYAMLHWNTLWCIYMYIRINTFRLQI